MDPPRAAAGDPLRVLWISTKAPWPPRDGGRLLQGLTLEALAAEDVEITLVAPVDPAGEEALEIEQALSGKGLGGRVRPVLVPGSRRGRPAVLGRLLRTGLPWTAAAHDRPAVRRRVEALLAGTRFDVVHAEQVQSWPQTAPARARGVPVVLRAQNVESDLWRQTAGLPGLPRPIGWALRREAERLARWEGRAVRDASAVTALTGEDAERLSALAGGRAVTPVAAPFPERLPAGEGRLAGDPALVLLGSGGWLPNRDAGRWFLEQIWPEVLRAEPAARLHVFGGDEPDDQPDGKGVHRHPAPPDSREALAPGSVLVVPLRVASGVRMKILEAWARGIPVTATPQAAAGLGAEDGRELFLFRDAEQLADRLRRLQESPALAESTVAAARSRLRQSHDPGRCAREVLGLYRRVASGRPGRGGPRAQGVKAAW